MRKSALVVDDESEIRSLIVDLINAEAGDGIQVLESDDGLDALQKISNQQFELLITDLRMPKVDGKGLLERLKSIDKKFRPKHIVVLSGFLESGQAGRTIHNITYLSKPIDNDELGYRIKLAFGLIEEKPKPSIGQSEIDANFITPFVESALKVIGVTCSTEAKREDLFVRKNDETSGDISALIAMNSPDKLGSMAVSFEEKCFLGLVGRMLASEFSEITDDIKDAAGEICNQIYGAAKVKLNEMGYNIQPAIPSVIVGKNHAIKHLVQGTCLAIKFNCEFGTFTLEAITNGR